MHRFLWIVFIFSLNGSTCFRLSLVHHQEQHLISCTAQLVHAGTSKDYSQEFVYLGLYTHRSMVHGTYNIKLTVSVLTSSNHENIKQGRCFGTKKYKTSAICCFYMQMKRRVVGTNKEQRYNTQQAVKM